MQVIIQTVKREVFGRKVKKLRKEGIIPANVFGKKVKSLAVQVSRKDLETAFAKSGETGLIQLRVGKEDKSRPVLMANLQRNPVTHDLLHVDFHEVDLTQKVTVAVPIEISGESPAVKEKGAVLITLLDEVKVEALPTDLPEKIAVDIGILSNFGDSITVKDLPIDRVKVKVLVDEDEAVFMVQQPKEEGETEKTQETETPTETEPETGEPK